MKYYAVTEDPRELYHYGVKGMKWGQHLFGDKPKSPGYHRAVKKLKSFMNKASSSLKSAGKAAQKTAAQVSYNARAAQDKRLNRKVEKAQNKLDKSNTKFENFKADQVAQKVQKVINKKLRAEQKVVNKEQRAIAKDEKARNALAKADTMLENDQNKRAVKSMQKAINKEVKAIKRQINAGNRKIAVENFKQNAKAFKNDAASAVKNAAAQASYNIRKHEEDKFQKAVAKAQARNDLHTALRSLDREDKFRKQVERDRKMEDLREQQADIMADNDLKALRQTVKTEKKMPEHIHEARMGTLDYSKLSEEQIGRLQDRLALEANARRFGSTEEPPWKQQKKQARRQGYLAGITKGTEAAMVEVAKAGVQYGIRNIGNKKRLDYANKLKVEREKEASRIKNRKSHSEMREDLKDEAYEAQLKAGVHAIQRRALSAREAAGQLRYANRVERERQDKINDEREERRFLMEERHNAARNERQVQERIAEEQRQEQKKLDQEQRQEQKRLADADEIGKSLAETGYAVVPAYTKDGKPAGYKVLSSDGKSSGQRDKNGAAIPDDGPAYLKLYESKYGKSKSNKPKKPNNLEGPKPSNEHDASSEPKPPERPKTNPNKPSQEEINRLREAKQARIAAQNQKANKKPDYSQQDMYGNWIVPSGVHSRRQLHKEAENHKAAVNRTNALLGMHQKYKSLQEESKNIQEEYNKIKNEAGADQQREYLEGERERIKAEMKAILDRSHNQHVEKLAREGLNARDEMDEMMPALTRRVKKSGNNAHVPSSEERAFARAMTRALNDASRSNRRNADSNETYRNANGSKGWDEDMLRQIEDQQRVNAEYRRAQEARNTSGKRKRRRNN